MYIYCFTTTSCHVDFQFYHSVKNAGLVCVQNVTPALPIEQKLVRIS